MFCGERAGFGGYEALVQCAVSCCQGAEENVGDRDAFVSGDGRSTPMMHYRQMIAPIVVRCM